LSPDGSWIAIVRRHENRIRLVPLDGGQMRMITTKSYSDVVDLNWAMDSHSIFVSSLSPGGVSLLHVDLSGNAHPIWQQPQPRGFWSWGVSSPDGHHLAMLAGNWEANAWMVTNF